MKSWKQTIDPILRRTQVKFDKIQSDFNSEVKENKITDTENRNKLWNKKYAPKFDKIMKSHKVEVQKIWDKYHKK